MERIHDIRYTMYTQNRVKYQNTLGGLCYCANLFKTMCTEFY